VTIYELGHENNTPFIAMEFIEGGSLDHLIEQRQTFPMSVKLGYIVRVCEALSYAHRHNVVHRDINRETSWSPRKASSKSWTLASPA